MKATQVSEHIWSLSTWMLFPIRVWIVVDQEGVTLIDAGIPSMAKGILQFIDQLGKGPLKRILLTHGHSDHVGAVTRIVQARPVPVYVHEIEMPFMEGKLAYPRRKKAGVSLAQGIAEPLQIDGQHQLDRVSGLIPYLTPGHSPGHVIYYHDEDQVLLAGDLFTSKKGRLNRPMPMFTADMQEAVKSGEIVNRLQPKVLEVAHGGPVHAPAEQWSSYFAKMTK